MAAADTVWLVQKVLAVAGRGFGVLVNRNQDRLNVLIAPILSRQQTPGFIERFQNRRRVCLVAEPL
jgi:hypothetical protein